MLVFFRVLVRFIESATSKFVLDQGGMLLLAWTSLGAACMRQSITWTSLGSAACLRQPMTRSCGGTVRMSHPSSISLVVTSVELMEHLGAALSSTTKAGDSLCLRGPVGAGKTCFARGFVRARTHNPRLRVTSPSYLLDNTYDTAQSPPADDEPM